MRAAALIALLATTACAGDETVAKYGAAGKTWVLTQIDAAPFTARATMTFEDGGWIKGQAPCNRFSVQQKLPYPWFDAPAVMSTKMACPDLDAEYTFFTALSAMTLSEVSDTVLLLTNETGGSMTFKAQ